MHHLLYTCLCWIDTRDEKGTARSPSLIAASPSYIAHVESIGLLAQLRNRFHIYCRIEQKILLLQGCRHPATKKLFQVAQLIGCIRILFVPNKQIVSDLQDNLSTNAARPLRLPQIARSQVGKSGCDGRTSCFLGSTPARREPGAEPRSRPASMAQCSRG